MAEYAGGDRRPIASRELKVFQRMAGGLARAGVSANGISVFGMVVAIVGGALLVGTSLVEGVWVRVFFGVAAVCIQVRLIANMLDGMVAIASGKASALGELFNEIPDRISDTAVLVGAGYAAGGCPTLGWAAACVALFVTYVRAVGKGVGVMGLFHGPMAKSHRMFLLTVACFYVALAPAAWQPMWKVHEAVVGVMAVALAVVVVGGVATALRRLVRMVAALRRGGK